MTHVPLLTVNDSELFLDFIQTVLTSSYSLFDEAGLYIRKSIIFSNIRVFLECFIGPHI